MVNVHRIQVVTTGYPGAPGYTSLHFVGGDATISDNQFDAVHAWLVGIVASFPNAWTAKIEPSGQILDEATGALGAFTSCPAGAAAVVNGTGGGDYGSGVSGSVIGLQTLTINRGRKVRGRIFLVPLCKTQYDVDGTLHYGHITSVEGSTEDNLIAGGLQVWSRPRDGVGGKLGAVLTCRMNDRAAFLSSRRS